MLQELGVVQILDDAGKEMHEAVRAFAGTITGESIQYRVECDAEKKATAAVDHFKFCLEDAKAASRLLAIKDKNLADAMMKRALQADQDHVADIILHQRAKLKFTGRKTHYESQPVAKRVLTVTMAKEKDIFNEGSTDSPTSAAGSTSLEKNNSKSKSTSDTPSDVVGSREMLGSPTASISSTSRAEDRIATARKAKVRRAIAMMILKLIALAIAVAYTYMASENRSPQHDNPMPRCTVPFLTELHVGHSACTLDQECLHDAAVDSM